NLALQTWALGQVVSELRDECSCRRVSEHGRPRIGPLMQRCHEHGDETRLLRCVDEGRVAANPPEVEILALHVAPFATLAEHADALTEMSLIDELGVVG